MISKERVKTIAFAKKKKKKKIEEVREEEDLYDQLEILSTKIIPRS